MPGHCIQNRILCLAARVSGQERLIACSVLGKRNVAVLPVKSTVFPLFTAARCPTDSPWLSVFTQSTRESCAFPQIQPVINHTTTISQARNGMA